MLKLSFAAALLLGANAVSSDAKNKIEQIGNRDLGDLSDLSDIPLPTQDQQDRINAYWAGNERCTNLFGQLVAIRTKINTDITDYRRIVASYNEECNLTVHNSYKQL